jgi:iron complex transport system permease protein
VVRLGLTIVALVTAVVVVVVGSVPFLGLVVPNIVSLLIGDNVRRGVPWVAILGAGLLLLSDIGGRLVRFPYEIPAGTVMGVVGAALFLWFLVSRRPADVG